LVKTCPFGTQSAFIDGMIRIAFCVEKLAAFFGVDNDATSHGTVGADGVGLLGFEDLQVGSV
jgi:hypothetical protein